MVHGQRLHPLLQLQRAVGNQAVLGLLRGGVLQRKLAIAAPRDAPEQEAERVAAEVTQTASEPVVQRRCACGGIPGPDGDCAACSARRLARQHRPGSPTGPAVASPIIGQVLRSPGDPLDTATRAFFEPRFGHDFSRVRVHTDARAAAAAASINAVAFTVGQDVAFGAGRYAPSTGRGRQLMAHELAHTVQQSGAVGEAPPVAADSSLESSAEAAGQAAANGLAVTQPLGRSGLAVARQVASAYYLSDEKIAAQIRETAERLKSPSYPGRETDLDWLKELQAVAKQRAAAKLPPPASKQAPTPAKQPPPPPKRAPTPAKPTAPQPITREAAITEAELVAAKTEVELLTPDVEPAPTSMRLGAKPTAKPKPPARRVQPPSKFAPGGFTNVDIEREYKETEARLEAEYVPKDRRPFSKRFEDAKKHAPLTLLPADFPDSVWSYGVTNELFAPAEQDAVYETLEAPVRARAKEELEREQAQAEYQRQLQAESHLFELQAAFIQAAILGGRLPLFPGAPVASGMIRAGYTGYSIGETVAQTREAIRSGDPTEIVGATLPVVTGITLHGLTGGEGPPGPGEEPAGRLAPEEVTPDEVRARYKEEPDAVKKNLSGSFHQLVWERAGGTGQAPLAFRAGRVIQVNELLWSTVGDLSEINRPEDLVTPYTPVPPVSPEARAPTLPDPLARTVPAPAQEPAPPAGGGTKPSVPAPRAPAPARPAPRIQPPIRVTYEEAAAAYRANPASVHRSISYDWHEYIYRSGGQGAVPRAYRIGGIIIVDPDYPL